MSGVARFFSKLFGGDVTPPDPPKPGVKGNDSYSLTAGSDNALRPDEMLPIVFGKVRMRPDLCANSYHLLEGGYEFLNLAYSFGVGTLTIIAHKIDTTAAADFNFVTLGESAVDLTAWVLDGAKLNYPSSPRVDNLRDFVAQVNKYVINFDANIFKDDGLGGDTNEYAVTIAMSIFHIGASSISTHATLALAPVILSQNQLSYQNANEVIAPSSPSQLRGGGTGAPVNRAIAELTVSSSSTDPGSRLRITSSTKNPIRFNLSPTADANAQRYSLRFAKNTKDTTNPQLRDKVEIHSIVCFRQLLAPPAAANILKVRARADEKLNGRFENFTAIVARSIRSAATLSSAAESFSANPADLLLDFLRGKTDSAGELIYGVGKADADIDTASIVAFRAWCARQGLECNGVIEKTTSAGEVLAKICAAGDGWLDFSSGKVGVGFDEDHSRAIVANFTEDNILYGSLKISYPQRQSIKKISVEYLNIAADYAGATVSAAVANAAANATEKKLDGWGVTNAYQAQRLTTLAAREIELRSKIIEFETSMDGYQLAKGDPVTITHKLPGWVEKRFKVTKVVCRENAKFVITAKTDPSNYYYPDTPGV